MRLADVATLHLSSLTDFMCPLSFALLSSQGLLGIRIFADRSLLWMPHASARCFPLSKSVHWHCLVSRVDGCNHQAWIERIVMVRAMRLKFALDTSMKTSQAGKLNC